MHLSLFKMDQVIILFEGYKNDDAMLIMFTTLRIQQDTCAFF